jgi:4-amino-4-deoxy-L-arabinose transferase-like glycosyltransferase
VLASQTSDRATPQGSERHTGRWRALQTGILALYLVLCLVMSVVNPLGEAYDEWAHFAYVRYVVREHALPASGQRVAPTLDWNATHHPPLYYVLSAALVSWVDMSDDLQPVPNPHVGDGRVLNAYIHSAAEQFPYRGSVLGMHLVRLVSTTMGLLTLLLLRRTVLLLAPGNQGLVSAALALLAFSPQFVFTHSIITNDAAVTLFCSAALAAMVSVMVRPRLLPWLGMWLALGAAFMSKANGVALMPLGVLVTLWMALRHRRSLPPAALAGLALAMLTLSGGLLYGLWRWEQWNAYMHGHHSSIGGALQRFILPALTQGSGTAQALFHWAIVPAGLIYMWRTYWASFGVGNVPADGIFYWVVAAFSLAALPGMVRLALRCPRGEAWRLVLPALAALLLLVPPLFLIPVSGLSFVSPGRYLMPLAPLGAMALAAALPWSLPGSRKTAAAWALAAVLLLTSAAAPWRQVRPAYAQARLLTEQDVQAIAAPVSYRFGDALELVGYRVESERHRPGDELRVALYWRCLEPMSSDYMVSVQALDPALTYYGGVDAWPGRGSYPTTRWQPGEIVEDRHRFTLGADLPAPSRVTLKVTVYDGTPEHYLAVAPAGELGESAALLGQVAVSGPQAWPWQRWQRPLARYGEGISLLRASATSQADGTVAVSLDWRCDRTPGADYTVFVHLSDPSGRPVDDADGPPLGGRYPTGLWSSGNLISERRLLDLPAGADPAALVVEVGLYAADTGVRLAARDAHGQPLANDALLLPIETAPREQRP